MAISDTITSMYDNTSNAYDMLSNGTDLTGINKNLENLSSTIFEAFLEALRNPDTLFTNLPKTSGSGSQITLNGTANAPMRITLNPTAISQRNIPSEYTQVDYIQSSGTQYINTGYTPQIGDQFEFKNVSSDYDGTLFSAGTGDYQFILLKLSGWFYKYFSTGSAMGFNKTIDNANIKINSSGGIYLNEEWIGVVSPVSAVNTNLYLFERANGQAKTIAKMGEIIISNSNNVIQRHYIPCKRNSDNVVGYYEKINGTFLTTEVGSFTYGAVVTPTPDSPQDIHTISGSNSIVVSDGNGVSQTNTIDLSTYNLGSIGNYENKFIRSGGENLLLNTLLTTATTKNGITATPNNDGSVSLSGTSTATTYFNLTNTDFGTTSFNSVYGGSTEYVANTGNTNTNIRIAYDSGNKYTYIQVNNGTTINVTIFPMINKGTTALPYVPYEKGWYYKEGIGKYVANNDLTGNGITDDRIGLLTPELNITASLSNDSLEVMSKCNLMPTKITGNTNNNGLQGTTSVNKIRVNLNTAYGNSVENANTFLTNNNFTIYYVKATTTYTKLTDTTLINQLENIYKNMLSYKGTTNISQVNNDLPFDLVGSAIQKL